MNQFAKTILLIIFILFIISSVSINGQSNNESLKIGIVGLTHTHVHWILNRMNDDDISIVGIVEPNRVLAKKYSDQYAYSMDIVFNTMQEMIEKTQPEAVTAFGSIFDHLKVVETCAPLGIHVMVEKPLAVNTEHSNKMKFLAEKNDIHLLTNYETTWYGSNTEAYNIVNEENKIGDIRRIIFSTGHQGPIEIGCNPEFLEWLTDPVLNGGGALTDFGCYGANLATWLMKGEAPTTVSCVTQQIKPDLYPNVEDDAIIVLTYPKSQVIIQASWNWSHSRKEMEVYGKTGYVICKNGEDMVVMENEISGASTIKAKPLANGVDDPFSLFRNVVKNNYKIDTYDPSSLENNMLVVQILEAAKHSAKTGKVLIWEEYYKTN